MYMRHTIFRALVFGFLLLTGVGIFAQHQSPVEVQKALVEQRNFLNEAIIATPYSALIVHTRVEIFPVPGESPNRKKQSGLVTNERHVYSANVLETFRGRVYEKIKYEMVVERGEGASISSDPRIVTLCRDSSGLSWPGTGASFPGEKDFIADARRIARQLSAVKSNSFAHCE